MAEEEAEGRCAVLSCICVHPEQDKLHGKGMRVHNLTKQNKQKSEQKWRCTVCKREK